MPGHADYVKNMITGAAQIDGAILVVSAADGVCLRLVSTFCSQSKLVLPKIVVFLNKMDLADPELVELVEMDIRELLAKYGFDGETLQSSRVLLSSSRRRRCFKRRNHGTR
jgi:elongation factor Tu